MSERMAGPLMPVIGGKVVLTALRESDIDRVVEACTAPEAAAGLTADSLGARQRPKSRCTARFSSTALHRSKRRLPRLVTPGRR